MTTWIGKVGRCLSYGAAVCIILAAVAVSIGHMLAPYLNAHRGDFAKWASDLLNIPIAINHLDISWQGVEPELVLQEVAVLNKQTLQPTVKIHKLKINLRLFQSILLRKPVPESIKIYGVDLTLHQKKSGQLRVKGLDNFFFMDNFTGAAVAGNAMSAWVFSQPNLILRNIDIQFIPEKGSPRSITLTSLDLHNTNTDHTLRGVAIINQTKPTHVTINLRWQGETFDIMHNTSHAYLSLYVEGVSLPQWVNQKSWQNLQIKQGAGDAKFWVTWEQGQLQKVQSQFQLYEVKLQSLLTKKMIMIPRLSGEVVWKQERGRKVITGKDIFMDFQQHTWPATQFSLAIVESDNPPLPFKRKMGGYTLQVSYLDLADSKELALASGFLPASLRKLLIELNPSGEIRSLNIQSENLSKPENNLYSAQFSTLTVNASQKFPGLLNMNGTLSWNGKQGNLILNSQQATVILHSIFANPLQFDAISGNIQWQREADGDWSITAKDFKASNADITGHTDMTMVIPPNASPILNLSGTFSVSHVERLENYLPVKMFEPSFVKWLHNRFQAGQVLSGKVIVQGKLSDFPFDQGAGKFLMSAAVKDLELEYAPGWPAIHHLYGGLVFSSHSMTADVKSAQIFDVPLTKVQGNIPYIGPAHPQILNLQMLIHTDLAQGLRFIQQSPLRDSIGKDLAGIKLSGAMGLNLALTIPLKTPEKSQIKGEVKISAGILQLPGWRLKLSQLAGILHFTEQTIQVTQMQGRLFDEVVNLNIKTIHPLHADPVVKAIIQSKIALPVLQEWLNMPLAQFFKGRATYTAELSIVSHQYSQPSQLRIYSDLSGLVINLPDVYAKKPDEPRYFQLLANFKQNQPLQAKIEYGKLLTAALTYEESAQGWQFKGGELHLGSNGVANWQSQRGVLVTGQVGTLDWNKWHTYLAGLSFNKNERPTEPARVMRYLHGIDIRAKEILFFGQHLTQARLQITPAEEGWQVGVTSPEMTGQLWLPATVPEAVIHARFSHFYLVLVFEESKQAINLKNIPAFSFVGESVRVNNHDLGQVALDVAPISNGLEIKKLSVKTDFFNFNAIGEWLSQEKKYKTCLQGKLKTKNMSKALSQWGLSSDNLLAGEGNINFDLTWPEAPYKPALANMSGDIALQLGRGRVIHLDDSTNTKMGFGRMLNILSLQTLPRRLSLDFTDVFEKGYSFDTMQGHFILGQGNAITKDTYFEGPIARIEIKGRIGLAAKDYDLILSVTPYVTGSIPIVATLAGGPLVGAVTWLVEKVASRAVSKVTTYHYIVTGPWNDPVWVTKK